MNLYTVLYKNIKNMASSAVLQETSTSQGGSLGAWRAPHLCFKMWLCCVLVFLINGIYHYEGLGKKSYTG